MKKQLLTIFCIAAANVLFSQINWQNFTGGPTTGFWDMDTMNNKLYVSTGLINEFDGTTWTVQSNYNASLNTPNKTKSAVKAINGKLYCGAKDFNTLGEGDVHYFDGTNWTLFQNTDFTYNGSYKIRAFAKYGGNIYMSGNFVVPTASSYSNIAKWSGTDWVDVGRNFKSFSSAYEIKDMEVFQGNLYITEGSNVWKFNGTTWDSIFVQSTYPLGSGISDLTVYNNELYISGFFSLSSTSTGLVIVKYNGSSFTAVNKGIPYSGVLSAGAYSNVGKMGVINNELMFVAKKASDNNTYLVSYNGSTFNELTKLANNGDWIIAGSEYTNYTKLMTYGGNLLIGGNFLKIGGQTLSGVVYTPLSSLAGVKEINPLNIKLTMYPNPCQDKIAVTFNKTNSVQLSVYDALGNEVKSVAKVKNGEDIHLNLNTGIYFCRFMNEGKVIKTEKLIVQ